MRQMPLFKFAFFAMLCLSKQSYTQSNSLDLNRMIVKPNVSFVLPSRDLLVETVDGSETGPVARVIQTSPFVQIAFDQPPPQQELLKRKRLLLLCKDAGVYTQPMSHTSWTVDKHCRLGPEKRARP